ncbi:hypothetical protein MN01_00265 [Escherichia phage MN01]|nr:hypothetical protein MN01_00265 [Escherichia phage MN01]
MQISNLTAGLMLALVVTAGSGFYLKAKVDNLKTEVAAVTKVAEDNAKNLQSVKDQINQINLLDQQRQEYVELLQKENDKLRADAKRTKVVAAKPKLVEKQINQSFDKFAQDFQELTK